MKKMVLFMVKADTSFISPGFITVVEVTFLMPPRLKFSLMFNTCDAQNLWLCSICLEYKHTDLPNREYGYNKNDKDSSWQEYSGVGLIWAAKRRAGVLELVSSSQQRS